MGISGTEPSSGILSKTKLLWFEKLNSDAEKSQNKLKPKRMVQ